MKWRTYFFMPMQIAGRITIGSVGFVLMAGGLIILDLLAFPLLGIPIFITGLLLVIRAIF